MTLNFEAEVNVPFDFDVEALAGEVKIGRASCRERV